MDDRGDGLIVGAARVPDGARIDVRIRAGRIEAVAARLEPGVDERVIDARGGALLPGLHDHHLHLFALAAARTSVPCGPPWVESAAALARALLDARGSGWVRGVGYHERVAGLLDRWQLDRWLPDRPVRIQHATGKLWILNSAAIDALGLDTAGAVPGIERDSAGRVTGRLFRLDDWLRERLGVAALPEVSVISRELASFGVTGFTDTSPDNEPATAARFVELLERGDLRQRVRLMGNRDLVGAPPHPLLSLGERKVLLDEDDLPDLDQLVADIRAAHDQGRGVACHCVTRIELLYALAAFREAGVAGDRIEHASVVPPESLGEIAALGLAVVTQPGFIAERGDRYLAEVESGEWDQLYRLQSLLERQIPLGLSSDAPYGSPDPWRAMRAAVDRRTAAGRVIGPAEALTPEQALAGFTGSPAAPGGLSRQVAAGQPADLCLLDRPWRMARELLDAAMVVRTFVAGEGIPAGL